jgi:hypothetical protein
LTTTAFIAVPGTIPVRQGAIAIPDTGRRAAGDQAEPLVRVFAPVRHSRNSFDPDTTIGEATNGLELVLVEGEFEAAPSEHGSPRHAAPFIAQHIAQEVLPEAPSADDYRTMANAYRIARDSTVEILRQAGGLDIRI